MDKNLGNVVGLILSENAPTKKYVLWGKIIDSVTLIGTKIYVYDWDLSQWVLLGSGGGGGSQIWKGEFLTSVVYSVGDAVSHLLNIYQAKVPIASGNPFNDTEWDLIGTTEASKTSYTVANPSFWVSNPDLVNEALDILAEENNDLKDRVVVLEGKSFYREINFVTDTQDTVSASFPITGIVLANTLSQQLSPTTLSATWGYSVNGGQTWIEGLTIGALNTALVGINTLSTSRTELRASMTNIVTPIVWEGQLTVTLKNINA